MLIKHRPEDFVVEELNEFVPQEKGSVSVYELKKKKLDTFEAIRRVAAKAQIPLDRIHYHGLKDRQGVTTQLISVERDQIPERLRLPGVWIRYLGRTNAPLGAEALRGNAFQIVVRDLKDKDIERALERGARTAAYGLINYFDDQRFGSLVSGQGLVARSLTKGDFEGAAKILLATAGTRDRIDERRFKHLVKKTWGNWGDILRKWGTRRHVSMIRHLKSNPEDFAGAFQRLPAKERAIHVFAYQSFIWNESVGHYLNRKLPPHRRSTSPYCGGRHVWPEMPADEPQLELPETWPLVADTSRIEDEAVERAVAQALADERLDLSRFQIRGIEGCFFKHYERDLIVRPKDFKLGRPEPDEEREGRFKLGISFALPPGAYATLVIKRLFGRAPERPDRPKKKSGGRPDGSKRPGGRPGGGKKKSAKPSQGGSKKGGGARRPGGGKGR